MKRQKIKSIIIIAVMFFDAIGITAQEKSEYTVDVCVYGGTASGVVAAYSAKKMGKSVLLVEPGKYLGGMTTGGLGNTDIGNKYAVTGLSKLFYRRVGEHYGKFEQWGFPPSVATKVINRFVNDANLEVVFQYRIISANVENKVIKSIELENSEYPTIKTRKTIRARQFIDCTYEGDLMARTGVSYTVGRESNDVYGETYNGVQLSVWHQFPDSIDPYRIEGDPSSGYCWGISDNKLLPYGSGDTLVQAYNFRLCLTDIPENRLDFEKPANYDRSMYILLGRAARKMSHNIGEYLLFNDNSPEHKYDVNNRGPLSTDMIGMNHDYPDTDYETRKKIWQAHVDYTKGLMYFMTHDKDVPEDLRMEIAKLGWAKDEFVDNDHFPTQLYIREARRMIGEYVMTQHNCQGDETVDDAVGMAAYGMDSHNCQRIVINGMVKNEGDVEYGGFPPYPVAYRSITPKREECTNLLVPVCASCSHIAYGSIRMEPVFMVLGQSAGVAASMAIDANVIVQEVNVSQLQKILKENPYLDGSIPEILIDDTDESNIYTLGDWQSANCGGNYKVSYIKSENKDKKSALSFKPVINQSSDYEVFFYCPSLADEQMSEKMAFNIENGSGKSEIIIAPRRHKNEWVSLGTYHFNKGKTNTVTIDGKKSEGLLFADALILVPK